jgi:sulfatase modifying factor 1
MDKELEKRLNKIEGQLQEFNQVLKNIGRDTKRPVAAVRDGYYEASLTNAGSIIEDVLRDIWIREKISGQPAKKTIEQLFGVVKDQVQIDRIVEDYIRDIQLVRNRAAHGQPVVAEDAIETLRKLNSVLNWYLNKYLVKFEKTPAPVVTPVIEKTKEPDSKSKWTKNFFNEKKANKSRNIIIGGLIAVIAVIAIGTLLFINYVGKMGNSASNTNAPSSIMETAQASQEQGGTAAGIATNTESNQPGVAAVDNSIKSLAGSESDTMPSRQVDFIKYSGNVIVKKPLAPLDCWQNKDGFWETQVSTGSNIFLVFVPEGNFMMGSAEGEGDEDESPQHEVKVDGFWIGKTEITVAQFRQFVNATGYRTEAGKIGRGNVWVNGRFENKLYAHWLNVNAEQSDDYPVTLISWKDANEFCRWLSRDGFACRLPTEAEWEKAARGTDSRKYPWGNESPDAARVNLDAVQTKQNPIGNVGLYPAGISPFGLYDMAGNAWEWCFDWYDENYYKESPSINPTGPKKGTFKVIRGSTLGNSLGDSFNVTDRFKGISTYSNCSLVGFRIVAIASTR